MKLVIDTDPGIDDALAIILATTLPKVELLGLTAVFGNTFVQQSSRNARFLLNSIGQTCPVSEGAATPYGAQTYAPSANVHGPEGFGAMTVVQNIGANIDESAAAFLVRNARENPGELVVCAIGPLTNIADALKLDPLFARNIKNLVIMGGALDFPGNVTPHAEANIFHDPAAADIVFSTDMPMVMIGLNATMKTLLTPDDFEAMSKNSPQIGGFIREISDFYLGFYRSVGIFDGCPMHDSTALLACIAPERFEMKRTGLRVILDGEDVGKTVADNTRPPVDVALDLDATWAVDYVLARIATLN